MNRFLSSIFVTLVVIGIAQADIMPGYSVSDAYVSGKLDSRLEELGMNKQTQKKEPQWKLTQNEGILRHCNRTYVAASKTIKGCSEAYIRNL